MLYLSVVVTITPVYQKTANISYVEKPQELYEIQHFGTSGVLLSCSDAVAQREVN